MTGETASFVIRFTQKIYQNEAGESEVQWRGNIRHVQGGDEKNFSKFDDVVTFLQEKLADLTITALENKSPEEQKSILSKSFDLWKKMATTGPKMVMETIKDPKKQIAHIQQQINEVGENLGQRFENEVIKKFTIGDHEDIMTKLEEMSSNLNQLNKKVEGISKKLK